MAASNPPSGSKPRATKSFSFEIGCPEERGARASVASTLMYDAVLRKAGAGLGSLRQGRIVLSIQIYKPDAEKKTTRGRSGASAKKTASSRGR